MSSGEVLAVDDAKLARKLSERLGKEEGLTLIRSERAMTDCHPLSMFSVQTARRLGEELGIDLDKRRFGANIFVDLASTTGFAEDRIRRPYGADRLQGVRLGPRARSTLRDDNDRSRYGGAEPRNFGQGYQRP